MQTTMTQKGFPIMSHRRPPLYKILLPREEERESSTNCCDMQVVGEMRQLQGDTSVLFEEPSDWPWGVDVFFFFFFLLLFHFLVMMIR